jgi:hypothetical protein
MEPSSNIPAFDPVIARRVELIARIVFVIAVVNFATFAIVGLYLGGDALNGRSDNGHYFLMNHGKYTEVSSRVWHYSRIHAVSVMFTHPLAIIAMFPAFTRNVGRQKRSRAACKRTGRIIKLLTVAGDSGRRAPAEDVGGSQSAGEPRL